MFSQFTILNKKWIVRPAFADNEGQRRPRQNHHQNVFKHQICQLNGLDSTDSRLKGNEWVRNLPLLINQTHFSFFTNIYNCITYSSWNTWAMLLFIVYIVICWILGWNFTQPHLLVISIWTECRGNFEEPLPKIQKSMIFFVESKIYGQWSFSGSFPIGNIGKKSMKLWVQKSPFHPVILKTIV